MIILSERKIILNLNNSNHERGLFSNFQALIREEYSVGKFPSFINYFQTVFIGFIQIFCLLFLKTSLQSDEKLFNIFWLLKFA